MHGIIANGMQMALGLAGLKQEVGANNWGECLGPIDVDGRKKGW